MFTYGKNNLPDMKLFGTLTLVAVAVFGCLAQTPINRQIPVQAGQSVVMHFD
jgi:hypothetical protein